MKRKQRRRGMLLIAGWREWVRLPQLGVPAIKAKLDTGAQTAALHAFDSEPFTRSGKPWLRFTVHPVQRSTREAVIAEAPLVDERWVRSSTGGRTYRPVIETRLGLGGRSWPIEVTLIRRDVMGFRLLLGRQALRRRIIVDPASSFLAGPKPQAAISHNAEAPE